MVFVKIVAGAALVGGCLFGAYQLGNAAADCHPYRVEKNGEQYVLRDKRSNGTKVITDGPVVGTLSERLDDLMADSKKTPELFWQDLRKSFESNYAAR